MPPQYTSGLEPGYNETYDSTPSSGFSSYKFFVPSIESQIDYRRPYYDKRLKPVTVFRPFPCASYTDVLKKGKPAFEPYRKDPSGRNFPGYWFKRLYVIDGVGNPSVSCIAHDPRLGTYDPRMSPLNILVRAVDAAVKVGQNKAARWAEQVVAAAPFRPDAKKTLEWSGMLEGADGKRACLSYPKEMYFMQGLIPMLGGEVQYGPNKSMPGWGDNPTCVFSIPGGTKGPGSKLMDLCNLEKEGYRGDPADFENRYVNGDLVAPTSGRFIFIYTKGGDPRQGRYASQPTQGAHDPYAATATTKKDGGSGDIGYDLHLEKQVDHIPAAMANPLHQQLMWSKWKFWDDVIDPMSGKVLVPGIFWYPTHQEQVAMLSRVLPADMLVYAFYGEHREWLTKDILDKAKAVQMPSVPPPPPSALPQTIQDPNAGWGASLNSGEAPPPEVPAQATEPAPWDGPTTVAPTAVFPEAFATGVPDQSMVAPAPNATLPDNVLAQPVALDTMFSQAATEYTPEAAASLTPGSGTTEVPFGQQVSGLGIPATTFTATPAATTTEKGKDSLAALAAAKAKLRAASKTTPTS